MKGWKLTIGILLLVGLTLGGCTRNLYNVKDAPVPSFKNRSLSLAEVKKAIMVSKGTSYVHYRMYDIEPGLIRCELTYKKHTALVDIPYTKDSYSILYKSSQNLKYEPVSEDNAAMIHRHYNTWIRDLDKSIKMNLSIAPGKNK